MFIFIYKCNNPPVVTGGLFATVILVFFKGSILVLKSTVQKKQTVSQACRDLSRIYPEIPRQPEG